jgi:large subunit ribosomal protein L23
MRNPHEIIERPLLTEKGTDLASQNKFLFKVSMSSNKIEIAQAIEAIYSTNAAPVKVLSVNTLHVKGKKRRAMTKGGKPGYSPDWKKAVVTTDVPLNVFEELGV